MMQAGPLAAMVRAARRQRDVTVICYSGFTRAELAERPPSPGVAGLLGQLDVLIDGPLRGSRQRRPGAARQFQPDRPPPDQPTGRRGRCLRPASRAAELRVRDTSVLLVGVPPAGLARGFDRAVRRARQAATAYLAEPEDKANRATGGQP